MEILNEFNGKYCLSISMLYEEYAITNLLDLHREYLSLNGTVAEWFQKQQNRYPERSSLIIYQLHHWMSWKIEKDRLGLALFSYAMIPLLIQREPTVGYPWIDEDEPTTFKQVVQMLEKLKERYSSYLVLKQNPELQIRLESTHHVLVKLFQKLQYFWKFFDPSTTSTLTDIYPTTYDTKLLTDTTIECIPLSYDKHLLEVYDCLAFVREHIMYSEYNNMPYRYDPYHDDVRWDVNRWILYTQLGICDELNAVLSSSLNSIDRYCIDIYSQLFDIYRNLFALTENITGNSHQAIMAIAYNSHRMIRIEYTQCSINHLLSQLSMIKSLTISPYHMSTCRYQWEYDPYVCLSKRYAQTMEILSLLARYGGSTVSDSSSLSQSHSSHEICELFHQTMYKLYNNDILSIHKKLSIDSHTLTRIDIAASSIGLITSRYSNAAAMSRQSLQYYYLEQSAKLGGTIKKTIGVNNNLTLQSDIISQWILMMNTVLNDYTMIDTTTSIGMRGMKLHNTELYLLLSQCYLYHIAALNIDIYFKKDNQVLVQRRNHATDDLAKTKSLVTMWSELYQYCMNTNDSHVIRTSNLKMRVIKIEVLLIQYRTSKKPYYDCYSTGSMSQSQCDMIYSTSYSSDSSGIVCECCDHILDILTSILLLSHDTCDTCDISYILHVIDIYTYWLEKWIEVSIMKYEMFVQVDYGNGENVVNIDGLYDLLCTLQSIETIGCQVIELTQWLQGCSISESYEMTREECEVLSVLDSSRHSVDDTMRSVACQWYAEYMRIVDYVAEQSIIDANAGKRSYDEDRILLFVPV